MSIRTGEVAAIVVGSIIGVIGFIIFILAIVQCWRYRKFIGAYPIISPPVVVTSATHTAPGGYPVTQMPVGATTTAYQTQVYSTPYPPQGVPTHMPMPMPTGQPPIAGVQPHIAPYPPMPAAHMNPPSYDVAVSGAGAGPANSAPYEKQAPYNPNYQM